MLRLGVFFFNVLDLQTDGSSQLTPSNKYLTPMSLLYRNQLIYCANQLTSFCRIEAPQRLFSCSKSTIETVEKGVKYPQSYQ